MDNQNLEPVAALVAVLSLLLGPVLAGIVGPYAVIMIACTTGAAWSLGRRDPMARTGAVMFFLKMIVTALLITVPLAELAAHYITPSMGRWLLVPIAIMIGGIGDDWPAVGRFILERLGRLIDRKIDTVGNGAAGGAAAPTEQQYEPPVRPFRDRSQDR